MILAVDKCLEPEVAVEVAELQKIILDLQSKLNSEKENLMNEKKRSQLLNESFQNLQITRTSFRGLSETENETETESEIFYNAQNSGKIENRVFYIFVFSCTAMFVFLYVCVFE